jgi:hypothetical protein
MRKASALLALILAGGMTHGREVEGICRDDSAGISVRYEVAENMSVVDCLMPRMRQPIPNPYRDIRVPGRCHARPSIPGGQMIQAAEGYEVCSGNVGEWKCRVECD